MSASTLWSSEALRIIGLFFRNPTSKLHQGAIQRETGLNGTTVFANLKRFEKRGLLTVERERPDPRLTSRPARCLYKITPVGQQEVGVLRALFAST